MTPPPALKYVQAATVVRAQVADGTLKPGQAAPSGAQLARLTGFSKLTCRKALRTLISEGTLVPGPRERPPPRRITATITDATPGISPRCYWMPALITTPATPAVRICLKPLFR